MTWLVLAVLAHIGNGAVFLVEKGLLTSKGQAGHPLHLAFYSSILSASALLVLPLDFVPPNVSVVIWSLVAGALFVAALVTFFYALDQGEASRVVPITGSAVPLFTMLFARLFIGEELLSHQLIGVLVLILGGALLSIKISPGGLRFFVVANAVVAGACFAGYFAAVKHIYLTFPSFWSGFAYTRMAVGLVGLVVLWPYIRRTARRLSLGATHQRSIIGFFLGSKVLGAAAFIMQNYAISLGSVTVVNALQGVQYVFVFLAIWLLSIIFPRLYSEEHTAVAMGQKIIGTLLIGIGLIFVV